MRNKYTHNLEKVVLAGQQLTLKKGQIFQTTDTTLRMSLVDQGYVKRYIITHDGSLSVQSIYGPGFFFPLTIAYKCLLDQEIYSGPEVVHYEAMTNAVIHSIDTQTFIQKVEKDPSLYKDLFYVSGRRIHSNIQRIENVSLTSAYNRVAHQLVYFAQTFGVKKGSKTVIDVPLTHQDIADVIDSTRETVTLAFNQLKKDKLVEKSSDKKLIILDLARLQDKAYG